MAEEYCGGVNWWDTSSTNRSRFDGGGSGGGGGGGSSSTSSTTTLTNSGSGGYGWLTEAPTTVDSVSPPKMEGSSLLVNLGLSSQAMDWNQQPLLRNNPEKAVNSFRSMLQEGIGLNTNYHHDTTSGGAMFGSSVGTIACQDLTGTSFQLDSTSSTSGYCNNPSNILLGLIGSDQQNQHHTTISYQQNYFGMEVSNDNQQTNELHFTNNAPYNWNASAPALSMADLRPNFFSPLQTHDLPISTFEEKQKGLNNDLEIRETSLTMKKSSTESNNKRGRNEGCPNSSTMPPFKVRKEKMGDRITTLQQLVSPFGKTDTASVLSEAIEYIKFLHEQVSVLSTPYLKSGTSYQHHQLSNDKAKIDANGQKQDLRSRGLCLVPVSSTFPMTHETTVDFWTPTFGGTFR